MKLILFIALLVIGILFATQNNTLVTLKYYNFVLNDVTLYSVILLSIFIGFIGGVLYSYFDGFKVKAKLKNERKLRKELEEEIENLRTLPLTSDADDSDELMTEEEDIVKAIE